MPRLDSRPGHEEMDQLQRQRGAETHLHPRKYSAHAGSVHKKSGLLRIHSGERITDESSSARHHGPWIRGQRELEYLRRDDVAILRAAAKLRTRCHASDESALACERCHRFHGGRFEERLLLSSRRRERRLRLLRHTDRFSRRYGKNQQTTNLHLRME